MLFNFVHSEDHAFYNKPYSIYFKYFKHSQLSFGSLQCLLFCHVPRHQQTQSHFQTFLLMNSANNKDNFNSGISLASVLCMVFSITENPELLALHARQQKGRFSGENSVAVTAWIKCLARSIQSKLGNKGLTLLKESNSTSVDAQITALSMELDAMAKLLQLHPSNKHGKVKRKLKPVSYKAIEGVHIICPDSFECTTHSCNPRSLQQVTRIRDIPLVTLIKRFNIYEDCPVLAGKCTQCNTTYYADHECAPMKDRENKNSHVYLNSAKYLKVGQNIWVDRLFSHAVISGVYNFHASVASYAEYWNDGIWKQQSEGTGKLSRRQIWHTFVQESIQSIASSSGIDLELEDGIALDQITKQAFSILGDRGIIRAADNHCCSECTQTHRLQADSFSLFDPAATVGMDENDLVPELQVDVGDIEETPLNSFPTQMSTATQSNASADVRMVVVDGIVVGPSVHFFNFCC
jgi:hypothetical protein